MTATPDRPEPEPLPVDMTRIVLIGMAVWTLALLVLLPFWGWLDRTDRLHWLGVCLAGIGLGFIGLVVSRRRDRRMAAQAEAD